MTHWHLLWIPLADAGDGWLNLNPLHHCLRYEYETNAAKVTRVRYDAVAKGGSIVGNLCV
jgi:hypothetical protein